jgi:hypothetical protein
MTEQNDHEPSGVELEIVLGVVALVGSDPASSALEEATRPASVVWTLGVRPCRSRGARTPGRLASHPGRKITVPSTVGCWFAVSLTQEAHQPRTGRR